MLKVVFVGDEPSNLNASNQIAFVGARCFPKLVEWIKTLAPDYYVCLNSNTSNDLDKIMKLSHSGFKVITLGLAASLRLKCYKVPHYSMYHPSGLNRKLNNKKNVDNKLKECYNWLREN